MPSSLPISKSYSSPLRITSISQILLVLLTGFLADFGVMVTWTIYAVCTFWAVALLVILRRRNKPTEFDLFFVRFGFFVIVSVYALFGPHIYEFVQTVVLKN